MEFFVILIFYYLSDSCLFSYDTSHVSFLIIISIIMPIGIIIMMVFYFIELCFSLSHFMSIHLTILLSFPVLTCNDVVAYTFSISIATFYSFILATILKIKLNFSILRHSIELDSFLFLHIGLLLLFLLLVFTLIFFGSTNQLY